MIDRVKAFWNKAPCDSLFSDKVPGTREYFSEIAQERYSRIPEIGPFADFDRWKGRTVLEIGCGIGSDAMNFSRAGAKVTAIDLSEESLELARKNFEVWGNKGEFYQINMEEDITQTDFFWYSDYFDLIYSFGVLHHTPNPQKAFEQLHLLCSPYTELRIMLYAKYSFHTLWVLLRKGKGAFWKFNKLLNENAESQYGCPVAYHYTFKEVRKLMKDYEIVKMEKGYLSWIARYIPKFLRKPLSKVFGGYIFIIAEARFE
jgi:2-polyprenyl-3-methyl-5-hydroxy-6-metoxy-1,4-benzoquinol methylase